MSVQAKDKLFLFRIENETGDAWKIAFQTDASTTESRSYDTTVTKDGTVKGAGAYEATHSLTSYLQENDTYIAKLKDLVRKGDQRLEVWLIDRTGINDTTSPSTLPGEYSIDVVTSISESAGAEGNVEISIDTEVEEGIKSGTVTVTPSLQAMIQRVADEFEFEQPSSQG